MERCLNLRNQEEDTIRHQELIRSRLLENVRCQIFRSDKLMNYITNIIYQSMKVRGLQILHWKMFSVKEEHMFSASGIL